MDMHTDTTAHLAAEGAETPARAAATMRKAKAEGKIAQAPAAVAEKLTVRQNDLRHEVVGSAEAPSLAALLAKRNTMMDEINLRAEGDDAPDDEVTQANEAAFAVEHEILTSPCRTADDTVAKVAALVEFIREAGCPDESDVENVLADIGRVLRESTHSMHGTKVDRRDAHWALVPHAPVAEPAPLNLPGDLAAIVAAAEDYDVKFVKPAVARHGAADVATMGEGKDDPALKRAETLAWDEMDNHCDVYRAIVDTILDHRPATPKELLKQVEAWGSLLVKHFAWRTNAETLIGKLSMEDAIMIGEHMHASLKGISGASPAPARGPNMPPSFDAEGVAIVAEAKEIAKDIGPAQDAFHEANEAWVATKGKGEEGLLAHQNELEAVWWSHLNRFSATAERLFDLPAPTMADRARIVRAYAELMAPIFGDTDLDNKLAGLPTENLLEVISYLDGTRPRALNGRDEIRAAWVSAKAAQDEKGAWEQLDAAARAAEDGLRGASTTVRHFEDQNPTSGDGDPAYDQLTAAWDEASSTLFRTYHELLNMPAPDVAALARQIQIYSWVTNVTDHRIDGKTSWPLDPAEPKMVAAIDNAGDDDERGLLSLYRSACRLAGVELQPIRIEAEVAAEAELLAAE
ncbi:hypothetical protein [Caulobacter sp. SSI4214]|uniref:hypothetical protein n=1 Tax=Caulobacter sp. SSI4214 TaxID=2575739 RepID=UPI0014389649|nr:hypothetical protein [Caulobacter sp. SSI4214]